MLDDLRNSASNSFQDEDEEEEEQSRPQKAREVIRIRPTNIQSGPFLGMTPEQRFVVALLIFLMVTVLGVLLLVATQKVFLF
jgi:hypothetical protein